MFHIWSFVNVTWMLFCTISHAHKLLFWWIPGKITIAAIIQQPVWTQKSGTVIMQHNFFPTRSVNTQLHLADSPCMLAHKNATYWFVTITYSGKLLWISEIQVLGYSFQEHLQQSLSLNGSQYSPPSVILQTAGLLEVYTYYPFDQCKVFKRLKLMS